MGDHDGSTRYTESHEWVRSDGDTAVFGISTFAAGEAGDVTFVELPSPGQQVKRGDEIAEIETVKSVNAVYAPIDGEVVAVNEDLPENPAAINEDAEGSGWFARIKPASEDAFAGLMDADAYQAHVRNAGEA